MNRAVILTVVIVAGIGVRLHADGLDPLPSEVKRFIDVYSILESMEADPVNSERAFYQGAIPGMLRKLDPHSVFFDPGQFEKLKKIEKSTPTGFGRVVSEMTGR